MNAKIKEQVALLRTGGKPHRVMMITGEPGRGKSFMAKVIERWAVMNNRPFFHNEFDGKIYVKPDYDGPARKYIRVELVRTYKTSDAFNSLSHLFSMETGFGEMMEAASKRLANLITAKLLIIDDLGNERNPPPTFEPGLASLVEQRWDEQRPTWVITNLTAAQIGDRYGDRNLSRIYNAAKIIPFTGRDRRGS